MSEQQLWPPIADLRMAIKWLYKGPDPPLLTGEKREDGTNLATHRMIGDRFQGKSALLEFLFAKYVTSKDCPASGYDFYSARDNEALAALKKNCPYREQIILVHGPKVKLKSNFPSICMNDLDPRKTKPGQVFITCNNFYLSEEEKYASLLRFTKILELRADEWDHVSVFAIREAQEYINSQMRTNQARTQKEAAEDFVRFHNEALWALARACQVLRQSDLCV